jgi:hypothetical protein
MNKQKNMEKIIIEQESKNCPGIVFYPAQSKLEIKGRAIPENPETIFSHLDSWITAHFERSDSLNVHIKLEYINSGSSKYMRDILKRLTILGRSGKLVKMVWIYEEEDETILELGEHYRDNADIPLEIEKA